MVVVAPLSMGPRIVSYTLTGGTRFRSISQRKTAVVSLPFWSADMLRVVSNHVKLHLTFTCLPNRAGVEPRRVAARLEKLINRAKLHFLNPA